jgi:DNA-binding NarL/FixJ family response regulator
VLEAGDGEEALTTCRRYAGRIDLLLTDAVMPKISGANLARQVRSLRPETKVLFMSGFADSALVRHGVASGEIDCLLKPFGPEALAQAVRQALDAAPHPARGPAGGAQAPAGRNGNGASHGEDAAAAGERAAQPPAG